MYEVLLVQKYLRDVESEVS